MPISFHTEESNVVVFSVSGIIGVSEMQDAQKECEGVIRNNGEFSLLVLINKDFKGWSSKDDWTDTSFADRNDPFISKIAFVGDNKWRELMFAFSLEGLRPTEIEYFLDEVQARQWLGG